MQRWLTLVLLALGLGGCGGGSAKPLPDGGGSPDSDPQQDSEVGGDATIVPDVNADGRGDAATDAGPAANPLERRLTAGRGHTCAIRADKRVWCWGGEASIAIRPRAVEGLPAEEARAIASGNDARTCLLLRSGKIWCWDDGKAPAEVAGVTSAEQVAAGENFTCALLTGGTVSCWGANGSGQLGDGTTTDRAEPTPVMALQGVVEIGAGANHACARQGDGSVWCWGDNSNWQLGDGTTIDRRGPVQVMGVSGSAVQLAIGPRHGCLRTDKGAVWCWGLNGAGETSDSGLAFTERPSEFESMAPSAELRTGGIRILGGADHAVTCSRKMDGAMLCSGRGTDGQLGDGTLGSDGTDSPVRVLGLARPVVEIAVGGRHVCARDDEQGISCWGYNFFGQLGRDTPYLPTPQRLENAGPFTDLAAGMYSTMGRTLDRYYVWGDNQNGQLGIGTVTTTPSPRSLIGIPTDVKDWGVGALYGCWLRSNGQVLCAGGKYGRAPMPVTSAGTDNVRLGVGNGHACTMKTNGNIWCWGATQRGGTAVTETDAQLYDPQPEAILSVGYMGACFKTTTGPIWCYNGEYGNNSFQLPVGPDAVEFFLNGYGLWCSRKMDGTVWCGATPMESHQVDIAEVLQIVITQKAACARKVDGSVWCWGDNTRGVLGNGGGVASAKPVRVTGLSMAITKLAAGFQHVCGLDATGRMWCWGDNYLNQAGDGTGGSRAQPQPVVFP